ncbi:hypothetical protein F5I97DRAFT_833310 [Phlebopus sp. FC_14]|nr:hypothetical protein F5I97DRAFT_833310 [Phlebopus sp. FC_14]
MSSPPSSNVAPATFQTPHGKDAISPKQFLDFLSSLVSKSLSDEVKVIREKAEWVIMITGLSEQVYSFFPFLTPAVQETSNERIVLTHFSLDILERVSQKVQFFYDGEVALVKKLFVTLLGLCLSAESWLEVTIHGSKDTSDPSTLFARATNMLVCLLRDLLSSCFRGTAEAGWRLAVELLGEALELTQGTSDRPCCPFISLIVKAILRATHDQFPLDLNLFSMPRTVVAPFGDAAQPVRYLFSNGYDRCRCIKDPSRWLAYDQDSQRTSSSCPM